MAFRVIHCQLRVLVLLILFLGAAVAHDNNARPRAQEGSDNSDSSYFSVVPSRTEAHSQNHDDHDHHDHHHHHHHHNHFHHMDDEYDDDPSAPCSARISVEEHRMMEEAQLAWEQKNPDRVRRLREGRQLASVQIDVWFHVVTGNTGVLTDSDRDFIMYRLNEGFANSGFTFAYAGSTTTANGVNGAVSACTQNNIRPFQKFIRRGGAETLNIIVCDTTLGGKTENLGFATTPPAVIIGGLALDGVGIVHPDGYGTVLDSSESAIHEVGHFFGLKHTFLSASGDTGNGDGCDTTQFIEENGLYKLVGDGVADTPAHKTFTLKETDCAFTTCCMDANGVSTLNTCPGLPGLDPVKNFMNYISTKCSFKHGEFTAGQIARMVAQYETFRSPSRGINCGCPQSCTATVLATTAFIANGKKFTCEDDIRGGMNETLTEWASCYSTGSAWSKCAKCYPETCAALAPDPTTSKPLTRAPTTSPRPTRPPTSKPTKPPALPVLKCANKVRNACRCQGTLTCKNRAITRKCYPPSGTTYRTSVHNKLKALCS